MTLPSDCTTPNVRRSTIFERNSAVVEDIF